MTSARKRKQQEQVANVELPENQTTQGGGSMTQDWGDDTEEGFDEDQPQEDGTGEGQQHGPSQQPQASDDVGDDDGDDEAGDTSKTQDAFDRAAEKLTGRSYGSTYYVEIPDAVVLEDYVADWTEVHDWIDSQALDAERYVDVDASYREFRKQSQKEVNYLVKEFECRKSADAYARSGQSKTGVLDTGKLHTYKFNEDLFKKVTVLPDGKNHGLLFLLDWSGSMSRELFATVKQLLNLTAFCKKVQIPFEVYAFTNDYGVVRRIQGW
jgi:cobalamin biosynthesis protein CobT